MKKPTRARVGKRVMRGQPIYGLNKHDGDIVKACIEKDIDAAILRAVKDGMAIGWHDRAGNHELANRKAAKYGLDRCGAKLKQ